MGILSGIKENIRKQSFQPGWPGIFTNPFYFIRRALFINIRQLSPELKGELLDFGCGRKPYENLFRPDRYTGIDMEQTGHEHTLSKVDIYYDGKHIPFEDAHFDSVFCSEVLEHIFNLDEILTEINRVMKPGGKILITVPFCWNEHEVPYDFGRYTSFGISHMLEQHGFGIKTLKKSGHFASVNFQLWALYWYSLINTKNTALNYLLRMLLIIPINLTGAILLLLLPKNDSMYFNNIVLAEKISDSK